MGLLARTMVEENTNLLCVTSLYLYRMRYLILWGLSMARRSGQKSEFQFAFLWISIHKKASNYSFFVIVWASNNSDGYSIGVCYANTYKLSGRKFQPSNNYVMHEKAQTITSQPASHPQNWDRTLSHKFLTLDWLIRLTKSESSPLIKSMSSFKLLSSILKVYQPHALLKHPVRYIICSSIVRP